jgi:hypothetical protein
MQMDIETKNDESVNRLKNLLIFCNTSLAQQNILNGGPLLPVFYQAAILNTPVEKTVFENMVKALKSDNFFLKANMATYILHNALGKNKVAFNKFQQLYYSTGTRASGNELLKQVNLLLGVSPAKLVLKDNNKMNRLVLMLKVPGETADIELPVEIPQLILSNEMIYHPYVYDLYETRNKLTERLIEYDFMNNIKNEPGVRNLLHNNFLNKFSKETNQ